MSADSLSPPSRTGPEPIRGLMARGTLHFMGIGGAGMCALAEALVRGGGRVTGCDRSPGGGTRSLERMGVRVFGAHDPVHVEDAVALVVSSAIPGDHPEIAEARKRGIPVLKRARALGEWVEAGRVVAVAGTHGKTTTTAMVTEILARGGLEPTGFVGGEVAGWGGNLRAGGDELFVVEADEYDRSFHHLRPDLALVTSLEPDHLDVYGDLTGVREAFRTFLDGVPPDGTVLACSDDPGAAGLLTRAAGRGASYGFSAGSEYRGTDLELATTGSRFRVRERGRRGGVLRLSLPGVHNARNALGAAAAARTLEVGWDEIRDALEAFRGVRRRFQLLGVVGGIEVVDDYAHHPTEVAATLAAARQVRPEARVIAVFQPHLYTRTRDFAAGFGQALAGADVVWITGVYPAREAPIPGVDGALVAREVEAALEEEGRGGSAVRLHEGIDSLPEALAGFLRPGDLCLTLGAGSIEAVGPRVVALLEEEGKRDD